jgi:hypothetical protein
MRRKNAGQTTRFQTPLTSRRTATVVVTATV